MSRFALHLNDAGITLLDEQRVLYRQPGFALLDGADLIVGNAAFQRARINPRSIQHRYLSALTAEPLKDRRFEHLSAADLASRQLEEIWQEAGRDGHDVVLAVPAYIPNESLGLLLGITSELGLRVAALVDAAAAASRREYVNAVPVHVDMGLHATTLTRMSQVGQAQVERADVLDEFGVYTLYDTWLNVIAEAFVQQSRFDPLHTAATEQALLDQLARWLADASHQHSVFLELEHGGLTHRAEIETLTLINAVAPYYQSIASRLRALYRAGETPALQVSDRVARLPGLSDLLKARVGGEIFALEPGATARGALARLRDEPAASGGVSLRKQLPWDQSAYTVEVTETAAEAGQPTHILFHNTAYSIGADPIVLGSQTDDHERNLPLDAEMPGVSRRHCSVMQSDGKCVVEDFSRYGTFLNGHRISGSTVLQVGDTLRIGSPGFEFRLITTDESHGA